MTDPSLPPRNRWRSSVNAILFDICWIAYLPLVIVVWNKSRLSRSGAHIRLMRAAARSSAAVYGAVAAERILRRIA